jgi:glycosyltransferase involved in cell wall biosynthesis
MPDHQSPAVSVIVRALGKTGRICDALESLARQSRDDFEVVLVDMSAGSVEPLLDRFSSRLRNLRHLTVGRPLTRPVALNVGVIDASAPLIAILDEDNLYDPGHLELLVSGLEASGADYVYCGVRHATFEANGRSIAGREVSVPYRFDELILRNYIDTTGALYHKELWERVGGCDERFEAFEDWDFNIKAAKAGKLVHLPVISGQSREFPNDLDVAVLHRCLAGIYWKHRRLYRGRTFFRLGYAWSERARFSTSSIVGWRVEMLRDLAAWWRFSRAWQRGDYALTPRASVREARQP